MLLLVNLVLVLVLAAPAVLQAHLQVRLLAHPQVRLLVLLVVLVPTSVNGIKTIHVHYVKTKRVVGVTRMAKAVSVALLVKARAVAAA